MKFEGAVAFLFSLWIVVLATPEYCKIVYPYEDTAWGPIYLPRISPYQCGPINSLSPDPPEGQYPTASQTVTLKGDTGVSGTTIPSPSPSIGTADF